MTTPVASVVVPTYDRPRPLEACLEALSEQSFREPWEVVVVDDGSPQPLDRLAERLDGRLPLRRLRQDRSGPAAARNRGVREAHGEFVAFTDDDCRPDPQWLATLVGAARERPGSLVGGSTRNGLPDDLFASTSQLIADLVYAHFKGRVRPRLAAFGSPLRRAAALASLGVWQAANAAGFAVEALGGSSRKGAS